MGRLGSDPRDDPVPGGMERRRLSVGQGVTTALDKHGIVRSIKSVVRLTNTWNLLEDPALSQQLFNQ